MSTIRSTVIEEIKKRRPNISDSSVKTYASCLVNLAKKMGGDDMAFFDKAEPILKYMEDKVPKSRKTTLSALFVLTGNDKFRVQMLADCKTVNDSYREQKKDPKEEAGWMSIGEIKAIYDELLKKATAMLSGKMMMNHDIMMQFWLVAFLGAGVSGILPRRSMDYALLKIRGYEKGDNYYKAGKLYFSKYKTAAKFGEQVVDVPKDLDKLIKKWVKMNDTQWFLFSSNKKPLSSSQIARVLNKAFGKSASVDIMRHIYVSKLYENIPKLQQLQGIADQMGHSLGQQALYAKYSSDTKDGAEEA